MTKELVKEKVTRHDGSRDAIQRRTLTSGCNTRELVNNRNPLHIGRGNCEVFPLQAERVRERVYFNYNGTPQSLIKDKGLFAYSLICLFTFINHFTHLTHATHFTHFSKIEKGGITATELHNKAGLTESKTVKN